MSANVPIVRSVSWPAVLILIVFWMVLVVASLFLFQLEGVMVASVLFFILVTALQQLIPKSHKKGMKAVKQNDFKGAIEYFKQSVDFFTKKEWLDKYRAVTMFSASKMSYREMALCNIAFCYSQTGQAEKAKALYEEILQEYPENGIAYYALNSINTFSNQAD
ncbi:MAG: tetratricopeptide repeat protein [Sphingobacterium sp.]|jgi:tetratricopeptide (TPR) repeat protein|nr:tetratricopeptide repeat protein [Sphingobacterium sp.]